jgi:cytochrome b6-f complex iron-sulfur subunit
LVVGTKAMAKRPSVQEILEAARKGGAAKRVAEPEAVVQPPELEEAVDVESSTAAPVITPPTKVVAPAPVGPTPSTLGRPLTLKEKLAAARAGGAATAAAAPVAAAAPTAAESATAEEPGSAPPQPKPAVVPPPAKPLGRPMTLQEKLAAARGSSSAAPVAGATTKAASPKTAAVPAARSAGAARVLPPLEKITDPRDLAEALRQAGAKKSKEVAAQAAASAPPKPATATKPAVVKPQTVMPKPDKAVATAPPSVPEAASAAPGPTHRRGFMIGSLFISWVAVGWTAFAAGCVAFTGMMGRFMFPNVLAEPPSTVKVGEPSSFDPNDVNERFKAEAGFWIVRSNRYNGQDIIYALQSVCTHLGCPPNWLANEQKFKCPCHGSGFYITGINFEGPAPRPLERFKIALADDGKIVVDKSQKFQQELGQWSDPDSYIAV